MLRERASRWLSRLSDLMGTSAPLDNRNSPRVQTDFGVAVTGTVVRVEARGVDIGRQGVGITADQPLGKGLLVFVQLTEVDLGAFAYVRHCSRRPDGQYSVGLEFRDPLQRPHPQGKDWTYQRLKHGACGTWDAASDLSD